MTKEELDEFFKAFKDLKRQTEEMFEMYKDKLDLNILRYESPKIHWGGFRVSYIEAGGAGRTKSVYFPLEAFVDFDSWLEEKVKENEERIKEQEELRIRDKERLERLEKKFKDVNVEAKEYREYLMLKAMRRHGKI